MTRDDIFQTNDGETATKYGVLPEAARAGVRVKVNWVDGLWAGVTWYDSEIGGGAVVPTKCLNRVWKTRQAISRRGTLTDQKG